MQVVASSSTRRRHTRLSCMWQVRAGRASEQRQQRAPQTRDVLQKLSAECFGATSCDRLRTPGEGARAAELLGMRQCDIYPGEQLISVVRKGSRARQQVPASADAFVWHRLYQQELRRLGVPCGRAQPAWWTLRRP